MLWCQSLPCASPSDDASPRRVTEGLRYLGTCRVHTQGTYTGDHDGQKSWNRVIPPSNDRLLPLPLPTHSLLLFPNTNLPSHPLPPRRAFASSQPSSFVLPLHATSRPTRRPAAAISLDNLFCLPVTPAIRFAPSQSASSPASSTL